MFGPLIAAQALGLGARRHFDGGAFLIAGPLTGAAALIVGVFMPRLRQADDQRQPAAGRRRSLKAALSTRHPGQARLMAMTFTALRRSKLLVIASLALVVAWTLALVGGVAQDGWPGFCLLTDRVRPEAGDQGSAEELQDHDCAAR